MLKLAVTLFFAFLSAAQAPDAQAPDALLASKGLKKVGIYFVVDADAQLPASLRVLRKAEKQLDDYTRKRRDIDRDIDRAGDSVAQWTQEMQDLANRRNGVAQSDPRKYNTLNDAINQRIAWIEDAHKFAEKRAADREKLVAPVEHVQLTTDLAMKMEAAAARYAQLAKDPDVIAAIDALNAQPGAKVRLGPSQQFKTELPPLLRRRDQLESGALKMDTTHGVGILNVMINGSATIPMILDSGASYVSITSAFATQLGLDLAKEGRSVTVRIADGTEVKVPVAVLSTVRVGKYVAKDVICVVMPPNAKAQDCLLGGSFLKNFLYQIDLSAGVLHLTPITATIAPDATKDSKTNDAGPADANDAPLPPATSSGGATPGTTTRPVGAKGKGGQATRDDVDAKAPADDRFTLEIIADIDGNDDVYLTASEIGWAHGQYNWPTNVRINGRAWDPQSKPRLASRDVAGPLGSVDWISAQLVEKTGRGSASIEPRGDGLVIHFSDPAGGADHYRVKVSFARK